MLNLKFIRTRNCCKKLFHGLQQTCQSENSSSRVFASKAFGRGNNLSGSTSPRLFCIDMANCEIACAELVVVACSDCVRCATAPVELAEAVTTEFRHSSNCLCQIIHRNCSSCSHWTSRATFGGRCHCCNEWAPAQTGSSATMISLAQKHLFGLICKKAFGITGVFIHARANTSTKLNMQLKGDLYTCVHAVKVNQNLYLTLRRSCACHDICT